MFCKYCGGTLDDNLICTKCLKKIELVSESDSVIKRKAAGKGSFSTESEPSSVRASAASDTDYKKVLYELQTLNKRITKAFHVMKMAGEVLVVVILVTIIIFTVSKIIDISNDGRTDNSYTQTDYNNGAFTKLINDMNTNINRSIGNIASDIGELKSKVEEGFSISEPDTEAVNDNSSIELKYLLPVDDVGTIREYVITINNDGSVTIPGGITINGDGTLTDSSGVIYDSIGNILTTDDSSGNDQTTTPDQTVASAEDTKAALSVDASGNITTEIGILIAADGSINDNNGIRVNNDGTVTVADGNVIFNNDGNDGIRAGSTNNG